jgi:hypothetical protein
MASRDSAIFRKKDFSHRQMEIFIEGPKGPVRIGAREREAKTLEET